MSEVTVADVKQGARNVVVLSEPTFFAIKGGKKAGKPTYTCWGYTFSVNRMLMVPPASDKGSGASFLGFQTKKVERDVDQPLKRARTEDVHEDVGVEEFQFQ